MPARPRGWVCDAPLLVLVLAAEAAPVDVVDVVVLVVNAVVVGAVAGVEELESGRVMSAGYNQ